MALLRSLEERCLLLVRDVSDAESCLKSDGDRLLLVPFRLSLDRNRFFLLEEPSLMTVGLFPGEVMAVCERGCGNCCTAATDDGSAEEEQEEVRVRSVKGTSLLSVEGWCGSGVVVIVKSCFGRGCCR